MSADLHNLATVQAVKQAFAPDGGAEREHNAGAETLGFGDIHASLIGNLRPRHALVIGSRYGFVPAVIALAMRANGGGVLDFVDANYSDAAHGFATAYGGVGHWANAGDGFSAFGLDGIVRLHVMRSDTFFASCITRYDYVYLDGNHGYDRCREDFECALRCSNPGAMIVLHDVLVDDPHFGVGRLFGELDPARFDKLLIRRWPGLGIVQPKELP